MRLHAEEIKAAVKDQEWQAFRLTLKGLSTEDKINRLKAYYEQERLTNERLIRMQNYLNALSRGGLIAPVDLATSVWEQLIDVQIRR